MSQVILHSRSLSLYLQIATLVCEEKGVTYTVTGVDTPGEGYRILHPFQKMPVLQHGEILIQETLAIACYLDRAFEGPELAPSDARDYAAMMSWISMTNAYFFPTMMTGVVKPLLLAPLSGDAIDHDLVQQSLPQLKAQYEYLDQALRVADFLAGDRLSLADLFVLPNVAYASLTDEGAAALQSAPALASWLARMTARPSFEAAKQQATNA